LIQTTDNSVFGLGLDERFRYSNMEEINVSLGNRDDRVTLLNTATLAKLNVNLGGGDDQLSLLDTTSQTTINGGIGDDRINIQGISAATVINAGIGDDLVAVGTDVQTITNIKASLKIDTGLGTDRILVDTSADQVDRNGRLTKNPGVSSSLTGLGATTAITYENAEQLLLQLGSGDNNMTVATDTLGYELSVQAGGGYNELNLDFSSQPNGYNGLIGIDPTTIAGLNINHGGFSGINLQLGEAVDNVTLVNDYTGVFRLNTGGGDDVVSLLNASGLTEIKTGAGDDSINVEGIAASTFIDAGAGQDIIRIGANIQTLGSIQSLLILDGGGGSDSLLADAAADTVDRAGILTNNLLSGLGMNGGVEYSNFESTAVRLGSGNDHLLVESIATNTAISTGLGNDVVTIMPDPNGVNQAGVFMAVDTGDGNDAVNVQSTNFAYDLFVQAGAGQDQLNITAAKTTANNGTLDVTENVMFGLGLDERFQYDGTEEINLTLSDAADDVLLFNEYTGVFNLNTGGGDDRVAVLQSQGALHVDTAAGNDWVTLEATAAPTLVETGYGNDAVLVGANVQTVGQVKAPLLIDTGSGVDSLAIDNAADNVDRTIQIGPTTISGLGEANGMRYDGVDTVAIHLGSGQNTILTSATQSPNAPNNYAAGTDPAYPLTDLVLDRDGNPVTTNDLTPIQLAGKIYQLPVNGLDQVTLQSEVEASKIKGFLVKSWEKMIGLRAK
jgi:hypothetical protein